MCQIKKCVFLGTLISRRWDSWLLHIGVRSTILYMVFVQWRFGKFVPQNLWSAEKMKKNRIFFQTVITFSIFGVRKKIRYLGLSTDGDLSIEHIFSCKKYFFEPPHKHIGYSKTRFRPNNIRDIRQSCVLLNTICLCEKVEK